MYGIIQKITDKTREKVEDLIYKTFKPEFINRLDAIVFFKMLTERDVEKIAQIKIKELQGRLKEKHITMHISEAAISELAKRGYSPEFGARPLKRTIDQYITVPLSHYILKHPETKAITVGLKEKEITLKSLLKIKTQK